MWRRASLMLMAIGFLWTGVVSAQNRELPTNPRFVFPTTPEVVVKLVKSSNSKYIRGKLLSITAAEVMIDTGKSSARDRLNGDVGQSIRFDRIENVRTSDGRLEFTPDEDFLLGVAPKITAAYSSVTVETDTASAGNIPKDSTSEMQEPSDSPRPSKPPVDGLGKGGFGGINNIPVKTKNNSPVTATNSTEGSVTEMTPDPAKTSPVPATSEATEVLICSNCMKDIPESAKKTGVCPHCKIAFSNFTLPANPASNDPFAKPGSSQKGAFDATPNTTGTPVAPATGGSQIIQGSGFSIDSVPNWAKGGLFVLLVLIAWHMMFNR